VPVQQPAPRHLCHTGTKHFHHPIVGDPTVGFESLYVGDNLDLNFVTYTAEPNSPSPEALRFLASRPALRQTSTPHEPPARQSRQQSTEGQRQLIQRFRRYLRDGTLGVPQDGPPAATSDPHWTDV